jgi:DNA-binding transcriptional LysR family regulator
MELHNVDLNKVATVLTIAETGSVTAAAAELSLTRSAVSHSLRSIESELGIPLFHRVGRGLVLTAEGKLLKQAAIDVRSRLDTAHEVRGPVRVGLFLGFSRFRLAAAIDAFTERHPAAELRLSFGPHAWLIQQLLEGKVDMTLSLLPAVEHRARIRSEKLSVRPLVLAIPRAIKPPRGFAAVSELAVVDYYRSDPLIDRWTRHHFGGRILPRERIRAWVASADLALELVLRGRFGAVVPEDIAEPFRQTKALHIAPGSSKPLENHVWLNDLGAKGATRAATEFRVLLRDVLRGEKTGGA